MKNIWIFMTIMLLSLGACVDKPKPSEVVIAPAKMTAIISDLYEAEGKVTIQHLNKAEGIAVFSKYEEEIFNKYQVDSTLYRKSYNYYLLEDTPQMELIFKNVKANLQGKKDSLNDVISAKNKRK